jgi:hypothetical protein
MRIGQVRLRRVAAMAGMANDTAVQPRRRLRRARGAERSDSHEPLRGAQARVGRMAWSPDLRGASPFASWGISSTEGTGCWRLYLSAAAARCTGPRPGCTKADSVWAGVVAMRVCEPPLAVVAPCVSTKTPSVARHRRRSMQFLHCSLSRCALGQGAARGRIDPE